MKMSSFLEKYEAGRGFRPNQSDELSASSRNQQAMSFTRFGFIDGEVEVRQEILKSVSSFTETMSQTPSPEQVEKMSKVASMNEDDREKLEEALVKQAWQGICKNVPRAHRYVLKNKIDMEQFGRNWGSCA